MKKNDCWLLPLQANWLKKTTKILLVMKLTFLLLTTSFVSVFANTAAQTVTISARNIPLSKVFNLIKKQTGYVVFTSTSVMANTKPVSVSVNKMPLNDFMDLLLKNQPLNYLIEDKTIMLSKKPIEEYLTVAAKSDDLTVPLLIDVQGKVLDKNGAPVVGASILIKGTKKGTTSDKKGDFFLSVSDKNATIIISFTGYTTQEIALSGRQNLDIILQQNVGELDQLIVIGYGSVKKKDLTGAVSSVKMADVKQGPAANFVSTLQGRLAGVDIRNTSSVPGAGVSIVIRGLNSINGGNSPLYVIDGQPINDNTSLTSIQNAYYGRESVSDLSAINPNDIETIDILKDASATAIYGARGASGVVLITTKQGKLGKPVTEFNANLGYAKPAKQYELNDAVGYIALNNAALVGSGKAPYFTGNLQTPTYNTNWQKEIFRSQAPSRDLNLAFRGGSDRLLYNISANYFDQQGMLQNSDYKRYSLRVKVENQVASWLKLGVNITATHRTTNEKQNGVIGSAYRAFPIFPVLLNKVYVDRANSIFYDLYNDNNFGNTGIGNMGNPMINLNLTQDVSNTNRMFGNTFAEIKLLPGLKFRSMLAVDMADSRYQMYNPTNGYNDVGVGFVGNSNVVDIVNENTLNYTKAVGKHSINAVIGQTSQRNRNDNSAIRAERLNDNTGYYTFSGDTYQDLARGKQVGGQQWSMESYLGRLNYGFESKYLITASMRADGSSRFGKNNKWGYFPSASAAWVISEESFIKNIKAISSLKLRVGYGIIGSQEIGLYNSLATLGERNGVLNNLKAVGIVPNRIPNPNLSWEKTRQLNIGVDLGILNNRLSLTTDFYVKNTTDLLYNLPLPLTSGYSSITENVGAVKNTGYEITLNSSNIVGEGLNWSSTFTFSQNFNKVVKLRDGLTEVINGGNLLRVGEPLGTIYGYRTDGLFSVGDSKLAQQAGAAPGDRKYVDIAGTPINNPDGTKTITAPDGIINDYDRKIIGYSLPKFIYGVFNSFSFKSLECTFLVQGSYGNKTMNSDKIWLEGTYGTSNVGKVALNYWTPTNQNTTIERPTQTRNNSYGSNTNDYFMEDASYLRLRTLQIAYRLPKNIISKLGMGNFRVSLGIDNLITVTKYTGLDPDSNSSYPIPRTVSIGLNATL